MKNIYLVLVLFLALNINAQDKSKPKIYNPDIDVNVQLEEAIGKAKAEGKNVLIQIGGNWCSWCLKFHKFVKDNPELDSLVNENYVYILLNIDRDHKHKEMMKKLRFPNRFGYPVFVILDGDGRYQHTQNSALLELGKSYDIKKVKEFFYNWTVKAISPEIMK